MKRQSNQLRKLPFAKPNLVLLLLGLAVLSSCTKHTNPPVKRYSFTGRIVSLDKQNQSAIIDGDMVQGYMEAMEMSYKVKNSGEFSQLAAGDSIHADLAVVDTDDRNAEPEYWLENVKVTGHSTPPAVKPTGAQHIPSPGEEVPDFHFTNQNARSISLKQYRGQVLFITFIYTRCPFPDYCPRVGAQFAELNQQLTANPQLASKTHLLCISFDPAHDTPKVLRDYGLSLTHSHNPAVLTVGSLPLLTPPICLRSPITSP